VFVVGARCASELPGIVVRLDMVVLVKQHALKLRHAAMISKVNALLGLITLWWPRLRPLFQARATHSAEIAPAHAGVIMSALRTKIAAQTIS